MKNGTGVRLEVSGGFHLRTREPTGRMSGSHVHGDIEVNCIRRGAVQYLIAGQWVEVESGEALVFWGGLPHEMTHVAGPVEGVWITLPLGLVAQWELPGGMLGELMGGRVVVEDFGQDRETRRQGDKRRGSWLTAELLERWVEDAASGDVGRVGCVRFEVEAWFRRMAICDGGPAPPHAVSGSTPKGGERMELEGVRRALAEIHRRYTQPLDVVQIADAAGMHPKSLVRAFRRVSIYTPWEYVLRMRVAHAQSLLLATDRPVLEVALAAGFESMGPFYQAWRRWTKGETPSAFRRRVRGGGE